MKLTGVGLSPCLATMRSKPKLATDCEDSTDDQRKRSTVAPDAMGNGGLEWVDLDRTLHGEL